MRPLAIGLLLLAAVSAACGRTDAPVSVPHLPLGDARSYPTIEAYTRAPITSANRVGVLLNGEEILPALLAAIRSARATVTYAQYSWEDGVVARRFIDAFVERCRAGVHVAILLDGVGAIGLSRADQDTLTRAGCPVASFHPVTSPHLGNANNRNHRRILVVDGRIGFTGGSGVGDKWEGDGRTKEHWRDTDVRVEGPAVHDLQAAFAEMWLDSTREVLTGADYFPARLPDAGTSAAQVIASSPARGATEMYAALLFALSAARRSILITNPYFLPDDALARVLISAARRGVRVAALLPGQIDHVLVRRASRAGFGPLLEAGVEIHEYLPALLHAKTIVVDGEWSTIGSANFDNRSFALNLELDLVVYDRAVARRMEQVFEDDVARARRVDLDAWRHRPFRERVVELIALPIRDLL